MPQNDTTSVTVHEVPVIRFAEGSTEDKQVCALLARCCNHAALMAHEDGDTRMERTLLRKAKRYERLSK